MLDPYLHVATNTLDNDHLYPSYGYTSNHYANWQYSEVSQIQHQHHTESYAHYYHEELAKPIFGSLSDTKPSHMPMLESCALEYPSPSPSLAGSPMLPMSSVDSQYSVAPSNLIWSPTTAPSLETNPTLKSVCSPKSERLEYGSPASGYFSTFSLASVVSNSVTKTQVKKQAKMKKLGNIAKAGSNKIVKSSVSKVNQQYWCDYPECTKTFTRPYNLKSHKRTHTAEKPFACEYPGCSREFARQHDRNRHAKLHLGLKPYTCQHCNKSFARQDALNRHQRVTGAPCSILAQESRKVNRIQK
jgi:uncharacterized Zn-finger protein